jgi:hypothetical protein
MPSVIIAAHNEESVIARCLDALTASGEKPLDITVVANGCNDRTADIARGYHSVRVLDLPQAGKAAALNAGDAVAEGFPRVYLDADVVVPAAGVHELCAHLRGSVHAAVPHRVLDLRGRPLLVRGYYAVNAHHPAFTVGLFGRGAIAVSAEGRGRFLHFPELVADDLFLDSVFDTVEKCQVHSVSSVIQTPLTTRDLYRRLVRVRAGNAAMRGVAGGPDVPMAVRQRDGLAWLRSVVLPRPWLLPAGVAYGAITLAAALRARSNPNTGWGRDESTRAAQSVTPGEGASRP